MNFFFNLPSIAFVTGYVGPEVNANIPNKPRKYDGYYITDNNTICNRLKKTKWIPIFIDNITDLLSEFSSNNPLKKYDEMDIIKLDEITKDRFYTMASKALKVYPHRFIPKTYDYIVWSDNKFDVNVKGTIKTVAHWNNNQAMMLHKHPFIKNIQDELTESMKHAKYIEEREQYIKYINENIAKGLSAQHYMHYQSGYLLYNMMHPETINIQKTWQKHINNCGLNCQISFNFVAQLFNGIIDEYIYDINKKNSLAKRL